VFRYVVQSRLQDIDSLAPHCQFRKWLEDGPCWDLENTLNAISKAFHLDHIEAWQSPNRFKVVPPPTHHADGRKIAKDDYYVLYKDLVEAVVLIDQRNAYHEGDLDRFLTENVYARPEGWRWYVVQRILSSVFVLIVSRMCDTYSCTSCHSTMPGVFFYYPDIRGYVDNPEFGRRCFGCQLAERLDHEQDHYKQLKKQIMDSWVEKHTEEGELTKNTDDIAGLLEDFYHKKMSKELLSWTFSVTSISKTMDSIERRKKCKSRRLNR
jgi:hypothetical protein